MKQKCKECGGELMEGGTLAGMYATTFIPQTEQQKVFPKQSKIVCSCCKECGLIQNIRAVELDKIRK